ncbi:MAG TPA: hypothetical protein VGQ26_26605 [Streptosporangiaceae bacterium]|nr:hypothetical protein [Streptosporangiaceae bacterium]
MTTASRVGGRAGTGSGTGSVGELAAAGSRAAAAGRNGIGNRSDVA